MKLSVWLLVACGVVTGGTLVACGNSDDGSGDDMAASPDAASGVDAAAPLPDASSPADASSQDAAADAASPDASAPQDAEVPPPDSSVPDAGTEDAGADAAATDAAVDAGHARVWCHLTMVGGVAVDDTYVGCNGEAQITPYYPTQIQPGQNISFEDLTSPTGAEVTCDGYSPSAYGNCVAGEVCTVRFSAGGGYGSGTCL